MKLQAEFDTRPGIGNFFGRERAIKAAYFEMYVYESNIMLLKVVDVLCML